MKALIVISMLSVVVFNGEFAAFGQNVQPCANSIYDALGGVPSNSPLRDPAVLSEFFAAGYANGVDGRLLLSISKQETNWGRAGCGLPSSHNAFGWNGCSTYSTYQAAIDNITDKIAHGSFYFTQGLTTIDAIGNQYCTRDCGNWHSTVKKEFESLLGNSSLPVFYSSSCCGDCNHSQSVDISELEYDVHVLLDYCPSTPFECPAADSDLDGVVSVTDIVRNPGTAIIGYCPAP